jgi:DNA-directed RNA polymerase subunit H (RpoH/RPB5)
MGPSESCAPVSSAEVVACQERDRRGFDIEEVRAVNGTSFIIRRLTFRNVVCVVALLILSASAAITVTAVAAATHHPPHGAAPAGPFSPSGVSDDPAYFTPIAIASDGTHVWLVNQNNDAVIELNASTGATIQVIKGRKYDFTSRGGPFTLALDGEHVWVADGVGAVTELRGSTGALVKVIRGSRYDFGSQGPHLFFGGLASISSDGTHVWVLKTTVNGSTEYAANAVIELQASTGALVKVIRESKYKDHQESQPYSHFISSDGTHVWVANPGSNSVTELQGSTGKLVRVIKGSRYGFVDPQAIASDGTHVWVANAVGSVTELNASTGGFVNLIVGSRSYPTAITSDGTHVWMLSETPSVTELDASTGALVQVIKNSRGGPYLFNDPVAIASDGTDVWVANQYTVAELSASTGATVRVLTGPN